VVLFSVNKKICERRCFTISELSYEFPQISHTVLYEFITSFVQDGFRKCLLVPTKHRESLWFLLEQYHKDSDEFLSHIVTGDETWVLFVTVETKE
jgi:hypothetical protein